MRGYRALSQGKRLIHLTETITAGGIDDKGLPRLAVIRADVRRCWVAVRTNGSLRYEDASLPSLQRHTMKRGVTIRADETRRPPVCRRLCWGANTSPHRHEFSAEAIVPLVPAPLRPAHALSNYHILWEAEWGPVAPRDPALLKHLEGDLYVVLAVWDLTDLERAVLSGRLPA